MIAYTKKELDATARAEARGQTKVTQSKTKVVDWEIRLSGNEYSLAVRLQDAAGWTYQRYVAI